jgi:hypothetical protein
MDSIKPLYTAVASVTGGCHLQGIARTALVVRQRTPFFINSRSAHDRSFRKGRASLQRLSPRIGDALNLPADAVLERAA